MGIAAFFWPAGLLVIASLVRWFVVALRAPEFVYAARLCSASRRAGTRTYWRRVLGDFVLIHETADLNRVVRRIEMLCPRLKEQVLTVFTTEHGGEWLDAINEHKWRVRSDRLAKLGRRFGGIEVEIDSDPTFGSRIIATRKPVALSDLSSTLRPAI